MSRKTTIVSFHYKYHYSLRNILFLISNISDILKYFSKIMFTESISKFKKLTYIKSQNL